MIPYYDDLVQKVAPKPGQRVLVTSAGPGAELRAVALAMQNRGELTATDPSGEMIDKARFNVAGADLEMPVSFEVTEANDTLGKEWDLILNFFGLWQLPDRRETLRAWARALDPNGHVGILAWGPPDPEGPFELVSASLQQLEPELGELTKARELAAREAMANLLEEAGLRLLRHAIVRHPMEFVSAQGFFRALCHGCSFLRVVEKLGAERTQRVAESFYTRLDPPSPRTPLAYSPAAAIAIAEPI